MAMADRLHSADSLCRQRITTPNDGYKPILTASFLFGERVSQLWCTLSVTGWLPVKRTSMDVRFRWLTPESGHEWRGKGRGRKWTQRLVPLSGAIGSETPGGMWAYTPPPGLFRKFAGLNFANDERREKEIRSFADEYGDIIAQPQEGHVTITDATPWAQTHRKHATMETWCRAIQHMSRAVDLWDGINDPKRHKELRLLFIRIMGAIFYKMTVYKRTLDDLGGERYQRDWDLVPIAMGKDVAAYPARDITWPARRALQVVIQRALTDTETPSHATANLTRELRLVTAPVNLLADMWLTFARVVSGEIEERPCEICHRYIYVGSGPGLQRSDTITCSVACRKKKQRREDEQRTKKPLR